MTKPVREEVNAHQHRLDSDLVFLALLLVGISLLLPCQLCGVEVLERRAREVSPLQLPNRHVLIPARHELVAVVGVELDAEDWQVAQVAKG